jgi:hypothetical protein
MEVYAIIQKRNIRLTRIDGKHCQKYLGTTVVPLVLQTQADENSNNDMHSTLFMRNIDNSGNALHKR